MKVLIADELAETTRELAERNEELQWVNEQLRALTVRNHAIREMERTSIAREIHDVLTQELICLKMDLVWLGKQAAKPIDEGMRGLVAARIDDAIAQADAAICSVQHIATELRPVVLDSLGLSAAVEWQAGDFARRSGLTLRAIYPPERSGLGREGSTAVFRVLQECLTNIARHAQATEFEVRLTEDDAGTSLTVADNGRGISAQQITAAQSIGLAGMRERAQACGGTFEITGAPGAGTTVRVNIPPKTEAP
jgi:signal transduction histidine kinase